MKLLQYTWKNSMMKIANSKMAVFVILMIVVSRSYVGAIVDNVGVKGKTTEITVNSVNSVKT